MEKPTPPSRHPERLTVSPAEACSMVGIGRTHLYRLIADGRIRPAKLGRRTLIPVAQLHALLADAQDAAPSTEAAA